MTIQKITPQSAPFQNHGSLRIFIVLLLLSGCTDYIGRFQAFDAAAETQVDAAVDFSLQRLCGAPMDVFGRTVMRHGNEVAAAAGVICAAVRPELKSFYLRLTNPAEPPTFNGS